MKKNLLIVILICFVCLFSLVLIGKTINMNYRSLATDSGFDSSYDSGSSSSSSSSGSWDSSDSTSGGGGLSAGETLNILVFIGCSALVSVICYFISKSKKENREFLVLMFEDTIAMGAFLLITVGVFILLDISLYYSLIVPSLACILIEIFCDKGTESIMGVIVIGITVLICIVPILLFIFIVVFNGMTLPFILFLILITIFIIYSVKRFKKDVAAIKEKNAEKRASYDKLIKDNKLVEKKVVKGAFDIYQRVQIAWMNDDIDSVSDVLSDEMLNMYKSQLATMRVKNEQNIMSNIELKNGQIDEIEEKDNKLKVVVDLYVTCNDYIINKETKEVLRGKASKTNHYSYELTFLINKELPKKCPNCGTSLKKGGGVKCPSCGAKIVLNNGKMMMTDKKMISQS